MQGETALCLALPRSPLYWVHSTRLATLPPGKDRQDTEQLLSFLNFEQQEVALGLSVAWTELDFDNTTFTWTASGNGSSGDVNNVLPDSLPALTHLPRTPSP